MPLGMRVLRGPDWNQNSADGGEGHLGTVVRFKAEEGTAEVVWDNGQITTCRAGKEGKHDLRIYDNATVGVSHPDVTCAGCLCPCIRGLRWRCSLCPHIQLCSRCYVIGVHDVKHPFLRFTTPNDEGFLVGRRSDVIRVRLQGLFLGARVVRGPDWQSGDADGGPGGRGVVMEIVSPESGSARNAVRVSWDSGQSLQHRLGLHGKVDLVCAEEAPGPACYESHLPVLDVTQSPAMYEVAVGLSAQGTASDSCQMTSEKDGYQATKQQQGKARPKPAAVRIKTGDTVRVVSDLALLEKQQENHGGWVSDMAKAAGKIGTVRNINKTGDIVVVFGEKHWIFNPKSCTPAPGKATDFIPSDQVVNFPMESLQGLHRMIADFYTGDMFKMFSGFLGQLEVPARLTGLLGAVATGDTGKAASMIEEKPELVHETIGGSTALHYAVINGQEASVRFLVDKGSDVNKGNNEEIRPLHMAVAIRNASITKLLVEHGADVNSTDENEMTPLHLAVAVNSPDVLRVLIQNGASVNKQNKGGQTPLYDALAKDGINPAIVDALLGVDNVDFKLTSSENATFLHAAVHFNNPRGLEKLLARDSSMVNHKMDEGATPLHLAALNNRPQAVKLLLGAHADANATDEQRQTPLHLVCERDHTECCRLLLQNASTDVNATDTNGNTPLHLFISNWSHTQEPHGQGLELARYLIHHGARIDVLNNKGQTALDLAPDDVAEDLKHFIDNGCQLPENYGNLEEIGNESPASSLEPPTAKCATCDQHDADITVLPCAHKVVCHLCARSVTSCPECGKAIDDRMNEEGMTLPPTETAAPSQAERPEAGTEECKVQ